MRSGFVVAAFGLLVSIGCGSQPTASSDPTAASSRIPCADIKAPHHAYVVVQHMSGDWIQRCLGFAPTYIDGQTIMYRSGIEYHVQYLAAGKAVCQVDLEPRQYSECAPPNGPRWALYIESQGRWSKAPAVTPSPLARTYGTNTITTRVASRDSAPAITSATRPRSPDIDERAATSSKSTATIAVTPYEPRRGSRITSSRCATAPRPNSPSAESASPSRWMAPVSRQSVATDAAAPRSGVVAAPTTIKTAPAPSPTRAPIAGK